MLFSNSRQLFSFGTRRQFLQHCLHNGLLLPLSLYQSRQITKLPKPKRVIFVCRGNICRSPYAEYRARQLGINAESYGIDARNGNAVNPAAKKNAATFGVNLESHKARQFSADSILASDLILGMEHWHASVIKKALNDKRVPVHLLGIYRRPMPVTFIPDPYGLADELFRNTFRLIDSALIYLQEFLNE